MDQRRHIGGCWHVSDRRIHSSYQLCQKLCQLCQPFRQPPLPQPPFLHPPLRQPKPPPQLGHSPSCAASATEPCRSLNSTSETPARISLSRSATLALGASSFRFSDAASPCTVASSVEIPRTPAGSSRASACFTRLRTVIGRLRHFGCAQAITAHISRQLVLCKFPVQETNIFLPRHELRLLTANTECDSRAIAEIVLPVTRAVGKLRQEILGLNRADCKMARHRHINSAPSRRPKSCLRSQHNCIRCPDSPQ